MSGWKAWESGEVVNANEFQSYLQDQVVQVYAGTAARSSALGTAVAEGMVSYLEDSDSLEFYTGSSWSNLGQPSTNAIINGAFEINQRAFSSTTTTNTYGFDRWFLRTGGTGGTATYSAQTFTPGDAPVAAFEGTNFARVATTGFTGVNTLVALRTRIEDVRTFAGQNVTMSFYARAASGTPNIAIQFTQTFGSGGSSTVNVDSDVKPITTTWQRYSFTVAMPSISGKTIGANNQILTSIVYSQGSDFPLPAVGLQNTTIDVWGVQVEAGPAATPFKRNANSLQGELAACQRYYFRQAFESTSRFGSGYATTTTSGPVIMFFPVQMRTRPTAVEVSGTASDYSVIAASGTTACSVVPAYLAATTNTGTVTLTVASGLTAGEGLLGRNSGTAGFFGWSAEL